MDSSTCPTVTVAEPIAPPALLVAVIVVVPSDSPSTNPVPSTLATPAFPEPQLTPVVRVEVEPSLLGGAIASVGTLVFDGSLKTQLHQLRSSLTRGT